MGSSLLSIIQAQLRGIGINMKEHNCFRFVTSHLMIVVALVGCCNTSTTFLKVEKERTELINGIESYQSIDEFKSFLYRSSFQWESRTGQPSPKGRPPFNIYTITIKDYSHIGFIGELKIVFFNDRLCETTFYPSEIEKYVVTLRKSEGIIFDKNGQADISPHTHVSYATDYRNLKYIRWTDKRLDKEISLWLRIYG